MDQLSLISESAPGATYFYSGSNHAGEIVGLAEQQRHIGVSINELDRAGSAMGVLRDLPRFPARRVVANVARNGSGKPIIMLCRDRALLPQGDEAVMVAGKSYTIGFRKIAANVARAAKTGANVMSDMLQSLFGANAGVAGEGHKVVIQLNRAGWELTPEQLADWKASGSQVFVDSGAFSETKLNAPHKCGTGKACKAGTCIGNDNLPFPSRPPFEWVVVKPITGKEWKKRLAAMTKIAEALGSKCYLVAPDMVGHQDVTLERLAEYVEVVKRWRELGANVIVVLQKGALSQIEMDVECQKVLGFSDYVRGIPSKKAAATTAELVELANALPAGTRLHLLGLGVEGDRYAEVLAVMPADRPLFCDSVGIKRLVGRTNGPNKGPRPLTAIRDAILAEWRLTEEAAKAVVAKVKAEMLRRYFAAYPEAV